MFPALAPFHGIACVRDHGIFDTVVGNRQKSDGFAGLANLARALPSCVEITMEQGCNINDGKHGYPSSLAPP
jgi:hypothetical protein